jgi:DNA repair protein RadC
MPRRDVKPLAKALVAKFGSFADVIAAPPARVAEINGLGDACVTEFKIVQAAASRFLRGAVKKRPVLSSWSAVLDYCRTAQAFADREQFRVLFLDKRNQLIADEVQQVGTVDHAPVHPGKWSNARSNYRRPRSSWCTIILPAIRHRRMPTFK